MTKISSRGPISRFFLHDGDIRAITACTASIKEIYDKLGVRSSSIPGLSPANGTRQVKLVIDSRQAIARLEDQLTALCKSTALVCPLPRITGTFSDHCESGNVNVACRPFLMKSHRKSNSHPLSRVSPRDYWWSTDSWAVKHACSLDPVLVTWVKSLECYDVL